MDPQSLHPQPSHPEPSHLGLLRIEDYCFALDSTAIQRVICRPELAVLPDAGPLGTGALLLDGVTVPVFDVAPLLSGVSSAPKARPFLAILRHNDALLSLEIDSFRKVIRYEQEQCTESLGEPGEPEQTSALFPRFLWDSELSSAVGVMDTGSLFTSPAVRPVRTRTAQNQSEAQITETLSIALFQVHGRTFGIETQYVREALHGGKITPAQLNSAVVHGHYLSGDGHSPILHLTAYLQLPSQGGAANPQRALIIGTPASGGGQELTLGFLIETVVGTAKIPAGIVHCLDGTGMRCAQFYRGIAQVPAIGHVLLLDAEALLREAGTRRTSKNTTYANAETEEQAATCPFIVFRAGAGSLASALDTVEAVVPLPEVSGLGHPGDPFVGIMPWRERPVNLLDVGALMGDRAGQAEPRRDVIITLHAAGGTETYYGFLVNHVESLTSAVLEPAPWLNRPQIRGAGQEQNAEVFGQLIRFQNNGRRRNFQALDLKRLTSLIAEGQLGIASLKP